MQQRWFQAVLPGTHVYQTCYQKTNQWWKCVKRSSTGCRGSHSTTLQNENPVPGQPHNHASSDTSIKYSKTRTAMKNRATNTRDKHSQIFAQVVSQCDDNVQALLPREENRKRTFRYQRPTPSVPTTYADVRLPEEYTTTTNNQQFLQYDNGQNAENIMLIFYSPDSLERLANAQTFFIFIDGTFSVALYPFKQLYTIRVPFKDVTSTAVYAFLPNKCQDTYRELFQSIVDNCHASNLQFNVQTFKMQSFVQLQLYLVATSTTRAVSTTCNKHHGKRYSSLVWCLSTRTTTTSGCSVI